MRLKRHYRRDERGEPGADGRHPLVLDAETGRPTLAHIEIQHTGTKRTQHFSADLVAAALLEGWMTIKDRTLMLHAEPDALVYTILRVPGQYPSQTPGAGYEVIHFYECLLDQTQHQTYCAKTEQQRKEDLYLAMGLTPRRKGVARGE